MNDIVAKLEQLGIQPRRAADFEPFTRNQLSEIEAKIGTSLPKGYREFLLKYGGGTFWDEVNCGSVEKPIWFGHFLSFSGLVSALEVKREVLPASLIPFGDDGGGNYFCLGVQGKDYNLVYFHNHSEGWQGHADAYTKKGESAPPEIRYVTVHKLGGTFEEFILNMKREE